MKRLKLSVIYSGISKLGLTALAILSLSSPIQAAISDVPKSDSSYPSIKYAVDKGYLSLYEGSKFLPQKSLSREEMAFVLEKLEKRQYQNLTQAEWEELSKLASSFKSVLGKAQLNDQSMQTKLDTLSAENKALNHDVAKLSDELAQAQDSNQKWLIGALILGALGVLN